jgi:hypothetical protein
LDNRDEKTRIALGMKRHASRWGNQSRRGMKRHASRWG